MFCSGALPSLVAFGGMRDTVLRSPVEGLQKFSLHHGASPSCSQDCRPSSRGTLREQVYRIEHVYCWLSYQLCKRVGGFCPGPRCAASRAHLRAEICTAVGGVLLKAKFSSAATFTQRGFSRFVLGS